jgi:transcriptional regulator with XRE-family HTH domain
VAKDWAAVAEAIKQRMDELGRKQEEVIKLSGLAKKTVSELQHNTDERRRGARTLEDLSVALDWHPKHLAAVAEGRTPPQLDEPVVRSDDDIPGRLDVIEHRLDQIIAILAEVRAAEPRFDGLATEIETAVQRAILGHNRPGR